MKFNKKVGFAIFGVVIFLLSLLSYVVLRGPSPFDQLQRLSEVELPAGAKALLWQSDEGREAGMFELPPATVQAFAQRYKLKPDPVLTYELSNPVGRCAKEGRTEFLHLNEETGALEVVIESKPCAGGAPSI
jgi:hypothetical protein